VAKYEAPINPEKIIKGVERAVASYLKSEYSRETVARTLEILAARIRAIPSPPAQTTLFDGAPRGGRTRLSSVPVSVMEYYARQRAGSKTPWRKRQPSTKAPVSVKKPAGAAGGAKKEKAG
jgi:hypothetical protein